MICRGSLCLLWLPARIIWGSRLVNLEDLSSKITSSKPAVFSLFVVSSCFVSFTFCFFLETQDLFDSMELATTLKYQVATRSYKKKELISCPGSNYVSVILRWLLHATSRKPIHLNVSFLYFTLTGNRCKN